MHSLKITIDTYFSLYALYLFLENIVVAFVRRHKARAVFSQRSQHLRRQHVERPFKSRGTISPVLPLHMPRAWHLHHSSHIRKVTVGKNPHAAAAVGVKGFIVFIGGIPGTIERLAVHIRIYLYVVL